jgi:hypothetical protein
MNDDNEKSGARSAIILAAVVMMVAVLSVEFGLQTLVWLDAKSWASLNLWLKDVPQSLGQPSDLAPLPSAKPSSRAKPTQLVAYNYEFMPPWPGKATTQPGPASVQFRFDSGQVIVFFDPESQLDTVREMKSAQTAQYQQLLNVFGDQAPDTNYALYQLVYTASPSRVSPFMNRADAMRLNVLLIWKLSFGFDALPGIYSLDLGKNRGFEFGKPAYGHPVALRVFDERDKQFRFIFAVASGSNAAFTQDDVNLVVQSLEPVPLSER